jgi:hypothetical protein
MDGCDFSISQFIIELCSNISQEYMEVMTNSHRTVCVVDSKFLFGDLEYSRKKVIKRMGGRLGVGSDPATDLPLAKNRPDPDVYKKIVPLTLKSSLLI